MLNTKKIKKKAIKYNIWLTEMHRLRKLIKFKNDRASYKYQR